MKQNSVEVKTCSHNLQSVPSMEEVVFGDASSDGVDTCAELRKKEMQTTIVGIQEEEMVSREKFISTMTEFFPKYEV